MQNVTVNSMGRGQHATLVPLKIIFLATNGPQWVLRVLTRTNLTGDNMRSPLNLSLSQQENTQTLVRLASSQALGLFK